MDDFDTFMPLRVRVAYIDPQQSPHFRRKPYLCVKEIRVDKSRILKFFKLDRVIDGISGYVETRLELFKLEAREEMASITAKIFQAAFLILLILFALMLFSVAGCIALGKLVGSQSIGFLIGGSFYLILGILLYLLKDKLKVKEKINLYLGNKINTEEDE